MPDLTRGNLNKMGSPVQHQTVATLQQGSAGAHLPIDGGVWRALCWPAERHGRPARRSLGRRPGLARGRAPGNMGETPMPLAPPSIGSCDPSAVFSRSGLGLFVPSRRNQASLVGAKYPLSRLAARPHPTALARPPSLGVAFRRGVRARSQEGSPNRRPRCRVFSRLRVGSPLPPPALSARSVVQNPSAFAFSHFLRGAAALGFAARKTSAFQLFQRFSVLPFRPTLTPTFTFTLTFTLTLTSSHACQNPDCR